MDKVKQFNEAAEAIDKVFEGIKSERYSDEKKQEDIMHNHLEAAKREKAYELNRIDDCIQILRERKNGLERDINNNIEGSSIVAGTINAAKIADSNQKIKDLSNMACNSGIDEMMFNEKVAKAAYIDKTLEELKIGLKLANENIAILEDKLNKKRMKMQATEANQLSRIERKLDILLNKM